MSTWVALALIAVATPAVQAGPAESVWAETILLQPSGPAELALIHEFHRAQDSSAQADVNLVSLRVATGLDRAPLELAPSFTLRQASAGGAVVDTFGMRFRLRIVGTPGQPVAVAYGGYWVSMANGTGHLLEQGAA
ncbi:MAG: hypothetical protein AAGC55_29465, partial [Myxococcota bacterium]